MFSPRGLWYKLTFNTKQTHASRPPFNHAHTHHILTHTETHTQSVVSICGLSPPWAPVTAELALPAVVVLD